MRIGLALALGAAACGRIGFEPSAVDAAADAPTDAALGAIAQTAYLKASNPRANALFGVGFALSTDGSTLAVGAPQEPSAATGIDGNEADTSAMNAGAVYVFRRAGATWQQEAYVKASNTQASDFFGVSVALSADGSILAVGAYNEDSAAAGIDGNQADNTATDAGAVYVFTRAGATWSQQAYIKASNSGASDRFGDRVVLSADGSTLAVTAYQESSAATGINGNQADDTAPNAGAAYVFTRAGATWSQQAYLKASNTDAQDLFGYSLALSADGNVLAVGSEDEASAATGIDGDQADNNAAQAGAVYMFARSGTTWTQQAYLKASNTELGDELGLYVALSADGSTLAASAYLEDSNATGVNGDEANNGAMNAGAVYVFSHAGTTWSQQAYIKASNTDATDLFGTSVALTADGSLLAVGAIREDSGADGIGGDETDNSATDAGAVYLFARTGSAWAQQAYIKASNSEANDQLGLRLALSANGSMLAVSAYEEASDGTSEANNSAAGAGAVYVFQ